MKRHLFWLVPTVVGVALAAMIAVDVGYSAYPWLRAAIWGVPSVSALTALICTWSVAYRPRIAPLVQLELPAPGEGEMTATLSLRGHAAAAPANKEGERQLQQRLAAVKEMLGRLLNPHLEFPTGAAAMAAELELAQQRVKALEERLATAEQSVEAYRQAVDSLSRVRPRRRRRKAAPAQPTETLAVPAEPAGDLFPNRGADMLRECAVCHEWRWTRQYRAPSHGDQLLGGPTVAVCVGQYRGPSRCEQEASAAGYEVTERSAEEGAPVRKEAEPSATHGSSRSS